MIKKWHLKALVQKTISYLPFKNKVNFWFQKNITKGVKLTDQYFRYKIETANHHLTFEQKYSDHSGENKIALELGTGWYPIIPIAYFLVGFHKTYSIDLSNWLTKAYFQKTIDKFIEWKDKGLLSQYLPDMVESRWQELLELNKNSEMSLKDLCEKIRFEPRVGDARNMDLRKQCIHLITSNNTFEHIYPGVLKEILKEFKRVMIPGGVMSHFIDMTDHFSHLDSKISQYNFLKFSERKWKYIDNSIQPQNRLRFVDYKKMYIELEIPITGTYEQIGNMEALEKVKLSYSFSGYSLEALAVIHGYLYTKLTQQQSV